MKERTYGGRNVYMTQATERQIETLSKALDLSTAGVVRLAVEQLHERVTKEVEK